MGRSRLAAQHETVGVHPGEQASCRAPDLQLYLYPTGAVRACCRSLVDLGDLRRERLGDIWHGVLRRRLVDHLARGDWSMGCQGCEAEVTIEGRAGSFPATFDHWYETLGAPEGVLWPSRIEFNLSTICNLQCVQCSGESSSSIRIHREKRPPLPPVYGEGFFSDIVEFLPHLRHASFAGGEPFLAAENFRVWASVAEVAPDLPCTVITNATQWNARIEQVLDSVLVHPIVSIDGATPSTYDEIRVGADHRRVVRNIDRLAAYARERGTVMSLNFCLMPSNVHEFPGMLQFAELRGLHLNVCVVRMPVEHSLTRWPPEALRVIVADLERRHDEMESSLDLNLATWRTELARLRAWSEATGRNAWSEHTPTILMFPRRGEPTGTRRAGPDGGSAYRMRIGVDETIIECPEPLAVQLGCNVTALHGRPMAALLPLVQRFDVVERTDERYVANFDLERGSGRLTLLPDRDENGWAEEVDAYFEFEGNEHRR